jgi:hypothetical protein
MGNGQDTGLSIMEVEWVGRGYDVGDMWDQRSVNNVQTLQTEYTYRPLISPYPLGVTYDSLAPVLAKEGRQLPVGVMERLMAGTVCFCLYLRILESSQAFCCTPYLQSTSWKEQREHPHVVLGPF